MRSTLLNKIEERAAKQQLEKEKEERIQKALRAITAGTFKTNSAVARHFNVSRFILFHRQQGHTGPLSNCQENNRSLTPVQEQILVEWIKHLADRGEPLSKRAIHAKVADLSEVLQEQTKKTGHIHLPLRGWIYNFLLRHPDLTLKRPTGLDGVRTRNFNPNVVGRHFQILSELLKQFDVPLENMYNMDEKGIQLGGGRKLDGTWYLYAKDQGICLKTQNSNLELVTTIECVAADGSNIKPSFVFSGKNTLHEEYFEEDRIM